MGVSVLCCVLRRNAALSYSSLRRLRMAWASGERFDGLSVTMIQLSCDSWVCVYIFMCVCVYVYESI